MRGSLEAGKAIRLVAAFVVGVVLVMGGAMIYNMSLQLHKQRRNVVEKATRPQEHGATAHPGAPAKVTELPVPGPSVVQVPVPPNSTPSVAYVHLPAPSISPAPALRTHKTAPAFSTTTDAVPQTANPASETVASNSSSPNLSSASQNLPPVESPPPTVRSDGSQPAEPAQPRISQPHTLTLW